MNFIELDRENTLTNYLIQRLVDSGWMKGEVILVNCSPEYSSRLTQLINHKTSYLNHNELREQINLELPKKGMNQVLSYDEMEVLPFDRYLLDWVRKYVEKDTKYLFITNTVFTGRNLNKVRLSVNSKTDDMENMRFLSLFVQDDAKFTPDYVGQVFYQDNPPTFFWENKNK